jgi:protein phosphatase
MSGQGARACFRIDCAAATDVGRVREVNEDSYLARPDLGLWAVADGMGGHDAGDLASRTVVDELGTIDPPTSPTALLGALEERVIRANARLRRAARERSTRGMIGCTLAALVIFEDAYACVWSGDSRIYRIRLGAVEQVTRDHTEAQELVDRGTLTPDEARTWPRRNVVTRAIGVFDRPELEMVQGRLEDGDLFVICTDGLTQHLRDDEIGGLASLRPLERAVDEMIATTLARGATDNVTVVAVACREATALRAVGKDRGNA